MDGGDEAKGRAKRRGRGRRWMFVIACVLGVGLLAAMGTTYFVVLHRNRLCERNLRCAQAAVERFVVVNYALPKPSELEQILSAQPNQYSLTSGRALINPFTGRQVRLVPFSKRSAGDITYIPVPSERFGSGRSAALLKKPVGYYLIAYGYELGGYADIDGDGIGDGVRLVLASRYTADPGPNGPVSSEPLTDPPPELDTVWKAIQWAERNALGSGRSPDSGGTRP